MAFTETFLFTVVAIIVVCVTHGNVQATTIDSLRLGYNFGTNGKFLVPRYPLEQRMKELGVEVSEATFVSSDQYDTEKYGEVVLLLQHGHDITLPTELDHEQLEGLTTGSHFLVIGIPFTKDDEPGLSDAFDWGCDRLGDDVSFCRTLAPYMDDITDAKGDVCTEVTTVSSQKCSAEMEIRNMTGIFRDAAPFLADTVPSVAVGAAWVDRGHSFGLVFPCF
ncbi:hypothetical protein BSL78_11570 [Apostichopus japonicus]|uniref:Uncharacterized protein n=1 Tax=Stichopus japonicus TaxID=307972 RepID=A0A2G8KU54_STIJA|nr:hypothetical protein BSL78_11570 [Apostichopus japonicus]